MPSTIQLEILRHFTVWYAWFYQTRRLFQTADENRVYHRYLLQPPSPRWVLQTSNHWILIQIRRTSQCQISWLLVSPDFDSLLNCLKCWAKVDIKYFHVGIPVDKQFFKYSSRTLWNRLFFNKSQMTEHLHLCTCTYRWSMNQHDDCVAWRHSDRWWVSSTRRRTTFRRRWRKISSASSTFCAPQITISSHLHISMETSWLKIKWRTILWAAWWRR